MDVSSLVRSIAKSKGLSQKALAEVLGVSLDRVKSLTSGKVQKLAPAEAKAFVDVLHVRGQYIATGEGPIFKSSEEMEFDRRLAAISAATKIATHGRDNAVQMDAYIALVESLTTDEQRLVHSYRVCAKADQVHITSLAERLAHGTTKGKQK